MTTHVSPGAESYCLSNDIVCSWLCGRHYCDIPANICLSVGALQIARQLFADTSPRKSTGSPNLLGEGSSLFISGCCCCCCCCRSLKRDGSGNTIPMKLLFVLNSFETSEHVNLWMLMCMGYGGTTISLVSCLSFKSRI